MASVMSRRSVLNIARIHLGPLSLSLLRYHGCQSFQRLLPPRLHLIMARDWGALLLNTFSLPKPFLHYMFPFNQPNNFP
jgi:hypothetical protein